jgi:cell division septum initiation protein DivIVA
MTLQFLLIIAVISLIYIIFRFLPLHKRVAQLDAELKNQIRKYDTDFKQWTDYSHQLEIENQKLAKWKTVIDADEKAAELRQIAQSILDKASFDSAQLTAEVQQRANETLSNAQNEAKTILEESMQQAKNLKNDAQLKLDSATSKASEIIDAASKRAEEIAGSAYKAMENATLYENTVKAMKNIIEGYGDQYIIPSHSLLDDLAEDFGYTEAGEELKRTRDHIKIMIRSGTAATCEYVEANRRDTAVRFVIDAFNGKVDSILSRVRHDNAGKLEQEIRDAFTLVNVNGKAFRDARITVEYLNVRLDELKWAATAQRLKLDEQEEQRRIKEQIREEAKAQKEIERAIKDAAKEEELIRRAMEKAQQQIAQANAEQKTQYEQQLQELTQKLKEAEERNQRALSMAQQTKRGHVYIISNIGSFGEHVYKIGLTRRLEPLDRVRELGDSSVPFEFDVHALIFSEDAPTLESKLHKHFVMMQVNKVNYRKEFFKVDLSHIREEIEKLGLNAVSWTMAAEAREYRESMVVEQNIKDDPSMREEWIKWQTAHDIRTGQTDEFAGVIEEI